MRNDQDPTIVHQSLRLCKTALSPIQNKTPWLKQISQANGSLLMMKKPNGRKLSTQSRALGQQYEHRLDLHVLCECLMLLTKISETNVGQQLQ